MKQLTVSDPVSVRSVSADGVDYWINKEAMPVLRKVREALNYCQITRKVGDTAGGGVYVELWRSEALPTDGAWLVIAQVAGVTKSGAAQRAAYYLRGCFSSTATVVAQVGVTSTDAFETAAGCNARYAVDVTNRQVYLEARDDGTSPMRYVAVVSVMEANAA